MVLMLAFLTCTQKERVRFSLNPKLALLVKWHQRLAQNRKLWVQFPWRASKNKMQQVQSTGFRLGSTGWQTATNEAISYTISTQLQSTVRKARARRGAFLISSYYYYHRNVLFCPSVYYRYHQRSRLQRWLVGYLNRKEGLRSPPKTRYFTLYKTNVDSNKASFHRQRALKRVFPKAGLKGFTQNAFRSRSLRGWVDLELKVYGILSRRQAENLQWQLRESTSHIVPRAEFRAYNVFDFVAGVNPLKSLRHYVLQRFSKMLYQSDILASMYVATQLNLSSLFAHSVQRGLERHAGRSRQQRRFLMMVRVMSERLMLWKTVENRPLWRLSIFGKLDANMRRVHFRLRVGFVRYQEVDFLMNYSLATARTKYGTSSVRVWMRNLLN